jgi:hypothetical protein
MKQVWMRVWAVGPGRAEAEEGHTGGHGGWG